MKRIVLAASLIPLLFAATPSHAAGQFDGKWKGRLVSDVGGIYVTERVCMFHEKNFEATVKGNKFVSIIDQEGENREFAGSIGNDGRLDTWGTWKVSDDHVKEWGTAGTRVNPMNFSGSFSGPVFQGKIRALARISQIVCRGTVYMAIAPLSVEEVQLEAEGRMVRTLTQVDEAARLKAEAERKRLREEVALLKAEAERNKKNEPQPSSTGGGVELRQQLAMLKDLKSAGLIDEQEFKSKKTALLNRVLGLKQASSTPLKQAGKTIDDPEFAKYADMDFGNYHALVIGIDGYEHLLKLKTARNDANTVAKVLGEDYGFDVTLLSDASRSDILDAFDHYRANLGEEDNLLIYYAGHGWLDEAGEQGYWLPIDAKERRRSNWISNATISTTLKALEAKHVMVVADSCFSGTLVRGQKINENHSDYIERMVQKRARVVLTSGGLEPVADLGGGGHSPFAKAFIDVLSENNSVMDGTSMFSRLRRTVVLNAHQTPEYSDARRAGHDGGDFMFVRRK